MVHSSVCNLLKDKNSLKPTTLEVKEKLLVTSSILSETHKYFSKIKFWSKWGIEPTSYLYLEFRKFEYVNLQYTRKYWRGIIYC